MSLMANKKKQIEKKSIANDCLYPTWVSRATTDEANPENNKVEILEPLNGSGAIRLTLPYTEENCILADQIVEHHNEAMRDLEEHWKDVEDDLKDEVSELEDKVTDLQKECDDMETKKDNAENDRDQMIEYSPVVSTLQDEHKAMITARLCNNCSVEDLEEIELMMVYKHGANYHTNGDPVPHAFNKLLVTP